MKHRSTTATKCKCRKTVTLPSQAAIDKLSAELGGTVEVTWKVFCNDCGGRQYYQFGAGREQEVKL